MSFVLNSIAIFILLWWVSRYSGPFGEKWYWTTVSFKILTGGILGFIYLEYLQTGDTLLYFLKGSEIAEIAKTSFSSYFERLLINEFPVYKGEARTEFFAKLISPLLIITNQNYWLTASYLSVFSFMGCWYLARTIVLFYPKLKWSALISFLLLPSFVFWSSGMLKDGISISAMFVLYTFVFKLYQRASPTFFDCLVNSILLIVLIKLRFYLGAWILFVLIWVLYDRWIISRIRNESVKWVSRLTVIVLLAFAVSLIDYNLQFNHLPESITNNYQNIVLASQNNHIIFDLNADWLSIIINSPKAMYYGLFGPLPGQGNLTNIIYWLENSLLISFTIFSIYLMLRKHQALPGFSQLQLFIIIYILIMAILLPMAAPNFGTLMRYKAAFLPFLWLIVTYMPIRYFIMKKSV